MRTRAMKVLASGLLMNLIACAAAADTGIDVRADSRTQIEMIGNLLRDTIRVADRPAFDDIEIHIVETFDPRWLHAGQSATASVIVIPLGWSYYTSQLARLSIGRQEGLISESQMHKYMRYLAHAHYFDTLHAVDEFLGLDDTTTRLITNAPNADVSLASYQLSMLFLMIAHEYGHHFLGHTQSVPRTNAEILAREKRADGWALERMERARFNPIFCVPLFYFLFHMEQSASLAAEMNTHPTGADRFVNAAQKSRSMVRNNEDYYRARARITGTTYKKILGVMEVFLNEADNFRRSIEMRDVAWFQDRAEARNSYRAFERLGDIYFSGLMGEPVDIAKANLNYTIAYVTQPRQKDGTPVDIISMVRVCFALGEAHLGASDGLIADPERGRRFHKEAASLGFIPSQGALEYQAAKNGSNSGGG